jgi:hypothetical protein
VAVACLELFFLRIILPKFIYIRSDVAKNGSSLFENISNEFTKCYLLVASGCQIKMTGWLYVMQDFVNPEGIRCGVVGWINLAKFRA